MNKITEQFSVSVKVYGEDVQISALVCYGPPTVGFSNKPINQEVIILSAFIEDRISIEKIINLGETWYMLIRRAIQEEYNLVDRYYRLSEAND
jgi:hypothetical protein